MHTIKFIRTEDAKVNFEYKDNKRGEETEESESSNYWTGDINRIVKTSIDIQNKNTENNIKKVHYEQTS